MSENPSSRARACSVSRIEIASERLAARRHPLSHLLMMSARRGVCDPIGRVGVVEHDFRPARPARELAERREHRLLSQIGRDAEPQHEGAPVRVEPGGLERGGHAAAFEIVSDVRDMRRLGDLRLVEPAPLFGLRRRMIELEDRAVPGSARVDRRRCRDRRPAPGSAARPVSIARRAESSAKRLRIAMNRRKPRRSGRSLASAMAPSASWPKIGSASGSANTNPRSRT